MTTMKIKIFSAVLLQAVSAVSYGQDAFVPPHLNTPGTGMEAHYVHLHGESHVKLYGDRARFIEQIHQCQAQLKKSGVPIKIIKDEAIPRELNPTDHYIYSTNASSVTVTHTVAYGFSKVDCGLIWTEETNSVISTAAGQCTIRPKEKTALGACAINTAANTSQSNSGSVLKPQGRKQILGHQCDLYGAATPVKALTCLSNSGSFAAFPSKINPPRQKGMPLWMDTLFATLEAVDVKFDMPVNPILFQVPAGFTINSKPGPRSVER